MKLALLGDIHSNYIALEKCLTHCEEVRVNGFVFLGDYISDCPHPQKTMELIKKVSEKYKTWFIRGNREDYQLNYENGVYADWHNGSSSGSLLYTYGNLKLQDMDFFKACPITMKVSIEGAPEFTICHGSLNSTTEFLNVGSKEAEENLRQCETNLLICGHTHRQGIFSFEGKMLINPGSVGVPLGSNGKSQFAILHCDNELYQPELISLDYDVDRAIEEYTQSDLVVRAPIFSKIIMHEIKTGNNLLPEVIEKAKELALISDGEVDHCDIPEKYWEEAYNIIFHVNKEIEQH